MKHIGLEDDSDPMADATTKTYIPLDYNAVKPLLQRQPTETFCVCAETVEEIYVLVDNELDQEDCKKDCLLLMRVKDSDIDVVEQVGKIGWEIQKRFSEDSLVVWAAQGYDKYKFDVYIY